MTLHLLKYGTVSYTKGKILEDFSKLKFSFVFQFVGMYQNVVLRFWFWLIIIILQILKEK